MRKLLLVSLTLTLCLTTLPPATYAQTERIINSEEITDLMKDVYTASESKFIRKHDFAPEQELLDIVVIFYYKDNDRKERRYSAWYNSKYNDLKFYFVPKGAKDVPIQMIGDANADGRVDYIYHDQRMKISHIHGSSLFYIETLSDEQRKYWQEEYNIAIEGLKTIIK